ncbi:hypothetical protein [Membranihabitans maritimus]|uniref:hypothetical protein n=1 Tax=Membranihabitans maritimus TaxID=2904244 RepID=UPI001F2AE5ED|nr:hypothetical protein [Membranihabitans maritimus]
MTQIKLYIDSKEKWEAIKAILEDMNMVYDAQEFSKGISDQEFSLLRQAESDILEKRLYDFKSHRKILAG